MISTPRHRTASAATSGGAPRSQSFEITSAKLTAPSSAAGRATESFSCPGSRFNRARTADASRTRSLTIGFQPALLAQLINQADPLWDIAAHDGLGAGYSSLERLKADLTVLNVDDEFTSILHPQFRSNIRRDH